MAGPLSGINIVEFAGIGPGPFCGMMLADQGASVTLLHRPGGAPDPRLALSRSRKLVEIDLKSEEGIKKARDLVKQADGLIEGFRPGVMERLGLGPDILLQDNPQLIYGRMTGWGQYGPLAQAAGHDINYISISGALHAFGRKGDKPTPPINMVGDFGGGGMMLALGMVSALLSAKTGGKGQVVDCAMTDGSAALMAMIFDFHNIGQWRDERGSNLLDTGAHFYDSYETSDGKYISIGSIEPQFYAELRKVAGLEDDADFDTPMDPKTWPALKDKLTTLFKTKTRNQWCSLMEGTDICFAPVLSLSEAKEHPHNVERNTFVDVGGYLQPAPVPRYSLTISDPPKPPV
ncbi:Alpha-methylacyl-CoA racemase [hydrothermal vent metagenome]|uniref:Alpha-methylacyl-CoA racemase n=1 Tax=hydrothermal vent metagenome TaxID=652676 RepID=A0A3B0S5U1_9ZZZZ